jgi:hypothetical protein
LNEKERAVLEAAKAVVDDLSTINRSPGKIGDLIQAVREWRRPVYVAEPYTMTFSNAGSGFAVRLQGGGGRICLCESPSDATRIAAALNAFEA